MRTEQCSRYLEANAQKDSGKPKWKEELAEDEESGEEVTAEDMEEWREREEKERKAREAREAEEARKRREAERAAAAAEEERKKNARSKSKSSRSSSSRSHRSRSRRRRRSSSSSSRSSSKTRRKSGWDVADTSLIATAMGVPTSETMQTQAENKPLVVPPPPPPVARPAGDASPLALSAQGSPTPLPQFSHPPAPPAPPAPPPPPAPVHVNGAVLNAPLHGQMWEKLPVSQQGPGHMAHSVMPFPGAAVLAPQQWHPNMQWQPPMPPFCQNQTGSWPSQAAAAPMWQDSLQGGWPQQGEAQGCPQYPAGPAGPAQVFPQLHQVPQNVQSWAPPADRSNEERFIGRVKRFQDGPAGGYGFIDCDETKLRFTRDIYIHRNQMIGLQIGDEVSFTIALNNKGEPQARNVMKREDALLLRAGAVHGMVPEGPAGPSAPNLMDEHQARQFQTSLRGNVG